MTVTGVVMTPSFSNSAKAPSSVVISRSVNGTLLARRNSFVRWQNSHPGCEKTTTVCAIPSYFPMAAFSFAAISSGDGTPPL
jgi:hypothetical protein